MTPGKAMKTIQFWIFISTALLRSIRNACTRGIAGASGISIEKRPRQSVLENRR
jgi:hypothetical protein